jgi:hypothetical protein
MPHLHVNARARLHYDFGQSVSPARWEDQGGGVG